MKNLYVVSIAAALAMPVSANAADLSHVTKMPPLIAPVYNWTGCYVGGNVGAAWGRAEFGADFGTASATNSGFTGGLQVGCDYQMGTWLIGARNMLNGTNLDSGTTFPNGYTGNSSTTWFDTLTARLGYTVQPYLLLYVQGGGAWTRSNQTIRGGGIQVAQFASNKGGWTIGGGVEYMFAPHWTAFAEYNYLDFGSATASWTDIIGAHSVNVRRDSQNLLIGVNYRF